MAEARRRALRQYGVVLEREVRAARRPRPAARGELPMTGASRPTSWQGLKGRGGAGGRDRRRTRTWRVGEDDWHRAMAELIVPAYLAASPRAQSGHSGDAARWEGLGGCCSMLWQWTARFSTSAARTATCWSVSAAGLPRTVWRSTRGASNLGELADLARERLPAWREQIFSVTRSTGARLGASTSCERMLTTSRSSGAQSSSRRLLADVVEPGGGSSSACSTRRRTTLLWNRQRRRGVHDRRPHGTSPSGHARARATRFWIAARPR